MVRTVSSRPPCFDNANRFADCGKGTVTDQVRGLIWLKQADCLGLHDYAAANQLAASLGDGTHPACDLTDGSSPGDWRSPTKDEWQVIVDQASLNGCSNPGPFVPDTVGLGCWSEGDPFFGVQSGNYWASNTPAPIPHRAWYAALGLGNLNTTIKTVGLRVWPVRGGP